MSRILVRDGVTLRPSAAATLSTISSDVGFPSVDIASESDPWEICAFSASGACFHPCASSHR
jgi:hypothetical protein